MIIKTLSPSVYILKWLIQIPGTSKAYCGPPGVLRYSGFYIIYVITLFNELI